MLCSILIINLIIPFLSILIIITKKWVIITLFLVQKSTILKPEKVQNTLNYFQRKMNILEIKLNKLQVVKKRNVGRLLKSGCNEEENEEILKLLFKTYQKRGNAYPNFRKLVFRYSINSTTFSRFFTFANYIQHQLLQYVYFLLCSICRGIVYFVLEIIDCSLMMILSLGGAWDVDNEIIEPGKIQAITTSQLFWHKSVDIGSITIHTAGWRKH
jgi:putative membrane protein